MSLLRSMRSLLVVVCFGAGAGSSLAGDIEGVWGAMRYDTWWTPAGLPEPVGTNPIYPPIGQQSGSDTWRCTECHGWDYKGRDGAYGSGVHYTGIKGVLGSTKLPAQMFQSIKVVHGYGAAGMSDQDIWYIVEFLQNYLFDMGGFIDPGGQFVGDSDAGRYNYLIANGAHNCRHCHGESPPELEVVAGADPWQFLHKLMFGHPGAVMPSWLLAEGDVQGASDIGAYFQAGLPGPGYVGESSCATCHADAPTSGFFDGYLRTGHRWALSRVAGQEPSPDYWPFTPVPPLPVTFGMPLAWSDVEYVVGNYGWKALFVDRSGYMETGAVGEVTQWNLSSQSWVGYHAGEVGKPFDCGRCHTTGYDSSGHQDGLGGLLGTWLEDGVRCEACHGPAGDHVVHPLEMAPPGGTQCAECHHRDAQYRMEWAGGFMRSYQQAEELRHSPHDGRLTCSSCHDAHRSTIYGEGGVSTPCVSCHPGQASNNFYVVYGMEQVDCIECHMPRMGLSADARNPFTGDLRGHIVRMMRAPVLAANNVTGDGGTMFWKQNNRGESFVTLDYACLGCHQEIGVPLTIQEASSFAVGIHSRTPPACDGDFDGDGKTDVFDFALFLGAFGSTLGDVGFIPAADLDGNGAIDVLDFGLFASDFGCGV